MHESERLLTQLQVELDEDGGGREHLARQALDALAVPTLLEDIRDCVWRGGELAFLVRPGIAPARPVALGYELTATWEAARWEALDGGLPATELARAGDAIPEGHWRRATAGYWLRVAFESATPGAVAVRTQAMYCAIPFARRPIAQVERAVRTILQEYRERFLDAGADVPRAAADAAERLRRLGLAGPRPS